MWSVGRRRPRSTIKLACRLRRSLMGVVCICHSGATPEVVWGSLVSVLRHCGCALYSFLTADSLEVAAIRPPAYSNLGRIHAV
jgi:hypothetical protein